MLSQIIFIFLVISILSLALSSLSLAPWVPTWKKDLPRIFKLADLKPNQIFYDLGCGNGKTVIYAAENYNAQAIGLEMALPLYLVCKFRQLFHWRKNLDFKWKNLFKENLSQADVIYVFGLPKAIQGKLIQKFEQELKPGAKVISYVFPFTSWVPKIIDRPQPNDIAIYLYEKD